MSSSGSPLRIALLLSSLLASACTVGELPPPGSGGGGGGGDGGGGGGGGGKDPGCVDRLAPPLGQAHVHLDGPAIPNGTPDNAGTNCSMDGCHSVTAPGTSTNGGVPAPPYVYGGTLYKADKKTPDGGAVITISDGKTTAMYYADDGGNFSIPMGDPALPNPLPGAAVLSTACPKTTQMFTRLSAMDTGCGGQAGKCHANDKTGTYGIGGPIYFGFD